MKILQVIASLNPQSGGPVHFVGQFATAMSQQGHEVATVTLDAPHCPWLETWKQPVFALGPSLWNQRYCKKLVGWLTQHAAQYAAVVVHGLWQYSGWGTWLALHKTTTPYFVYPHGMLDPWFKKTYPLKHIKKWMYWPWAEYRVLRDARAVLFTSEQERIQARQSFWLYQCNEAVVQYGIADPYGANDCPDAPAHLPQSLADSSIKNNAPHQIIFLGRLHPKKGCDLVLQAWARVFQDDPAWHLVMAGPDQEGWKKDLQKLAGQLGIQSCVSWPGMLTGHAKFQAIHDSEVLILPSHQENFGIVVAESLACHVPVLISKQVNIWQEIVEDHAGLAADDNLGGTVSLLQMWRDMDSSTRQQMQSYARSCYLKRFTIQGAVDSFLAIVKKYT